MNSFFFIFLRFFTFNLRWSASLELDDELDEFAFDFLFFLLLFKSFEVGMLSLRLSNLMSSSSLQLELDELEFFAFFFLLFFGFFLFSSLSSFSFSSLF